MSDAKTNANFGVTSIFCWILTGVGVLAMSGCPSTVPTASTVSQHIPTPNASTVDLLTAVQTDVAVSSTYRDNVFQTGYLIDDQTETAWNSKSGDLVGAWIDIRLPKEATLNEIQMTVGFTTKENTGPTSRNNKKQDLFTGNHRITKIEVTRNGHSLGVFALDPEVRALQSIPVNAGGGVYRIEIVEVLPGTRTKWKKVCISELRMMGHSPKARPKVYVPRFTTGGLPRSLVSSKSTTQIDTQFPTVINQFALDWYAIESSEGEKHMACDGSKLGERETLDFNRRRVDELNQLAQFLKPIDRQESKRLEWLAKRVLKKSDRSDDLDHISFAILGVLNQMDDDEGRCYWAMTHAGLRFSRVVEHSKHHQISLEMGASEYSRELDMLWEADDSPDPTMDSQYKRAKTNYDEISRQYDELLDAVDALEAIKDRSRDAKNYEEIIPAFRQIGKFYTVLHPKGDLKKMIEQIGIADQTCGGHHEKAISFLTPFLKAPPWLKDDVHAERLRSVFDEFTLEWSSLERDKLSAITLDTENPSLTAEKKGELKTQCAEILNHTAIQLAKLDKKAAGELNRIADGCSKRVVQDKDFYKIAAIFSNIIHRIGNSEARCHWAWAQGDLLLSRLEGHAEVLVEVANEKVWKLKLMDTPNITAMEQLQARIDILDELVEQLSNMNDQWGQNDENRYRGPIKELGQKYGKYINNKQDLKELQKHAATMEKFCE